MVAALIAVRLLAALVLLLGPWTDSAAELVGWDVERFQELADHPGQPWVDEPVEYPPGSLLLIETVGRSDVVATHRLLVVLSLIVDLTVGAMLTTSCSVRSAAAYLLLGLPLVPMGLLRFDLWSVVLAMVAVTAFTHHRWRLFGVLVTAAALVKVWPALLAAAALAVGRWRAAGWAVALMALAGLTWLGWAGGTIEPVQQVLSLRGATGWHVESVPGSLVSLATGEEPVLELNAYRVGTLSPTLILLGRGLTLGVVAGLTYLGWRRRPVGDNYGSDDAAAVETMTTVAVVMLGSTAALVVTAPLLSPQFLLWLTPWAALTTVTVSDQRDSQSPWQWAQWRSPPWRRWLGPEGSLLLLTGGATLLTGATSLLFGPPDLGRPLPAVLLLVRDGFLVAVIVQCFRSLPAVTPSERLAEVAQLRPRPNSS